MTDFRKKTIINNVNKMLDWKLPSEAMGAFNVWFDENKIIVDVETSDGGVSSIEYDMFLEQARLNKGKVNQESFNKCYH